MGCLYLSLPFYADAGISHLPNTEGRTTLDSFLSLLFLFHLGTICHFNTLNTSRFEEKTDFAGLETIIKRKENLAKRSMEEVGIQGGRKGGNQQAAGVSASLKEISRLKAFLSSWKI